jgi:imidazole glycerol-phosphate synthase subunit HisH
LWGSVFERTGGVTQLTLCIIDYGLGNLGSIANMLKRLNAPNRITSSPDEIREATKLILPGVGAFDVGMGNLHSRGLVPVIEEQVIMRRVPILGICLGMQLMTKGSEEGILPGLGWIDAWTKRFDFSGQEERLPIPHMAWSDVSIGRRCALTENLPPEPRYYFVHSYYVECTDPADVLFVAHYGRPFVAAFAHGNIVGVQFHPEKSHRFGMALLGNFVRQPPQDFFDT